jgi:hypothetical protein
MQIPTKKSVSKSKDFSSVCFQIHFSLAQHLYFEFCALSGSLVIRFVYEDLTILGDSKSQILLLRFKHSRWWIIISLEVFVPNIFDSSIFLYCFQRLLDLKTREKICPEYTCAKTGVLTWKV